MVDNPDKGEPAALAKFVHHVSFAVTDLEAALHFYGTILGLAPCVPPRPDLGFPGAWLKAGDCEVHLIVPPATADTGRPPPSPHGVANHVAFRVEDYDATLKRLKAHGLRVVEGHYGLRQMWVQDPSGNVIEFIPEQ